MNPEALHKISYGLYVICSRKGERFNGQIANTVCQVTARPLQIAVCIHKENLTHEFIEESGVFTVSILSEQTPMKSIGHFGFKSGRDIDKFKDIEHRVGTTGAPIVLEDSIGYLEVEVIGSMDVGSHTMFLGKVVEAEIIRDGEPMTYAYYHQVKGGKSPKRAPTYIGDVGPRDRKKVANYRCTVCGYVYDPEKGDPDSGIEPGTPFEELPDDWVCPICGAGKDKFERED